MVLFLLRLMIVALAAMHSVEALHFVPVRCVAVELLFVVLHYVQAPRCAVELEPRFSVVQLPVLLYLDVLYTAMGTAMPLFAEQVVLFVVALFAAVLFVV